MWCLHKREVSYSTKNQFGYKLTPLLILQHLLGLHSWVTITKINFLCNTFCHCYCIQYKGHNMAWSSHEGNGWLLPSVPGICFCNSTTYSVFQAHVLLIYWHTLLWTMGKHLFLWPLDIFSSKKYFLFLHRLDLKSSQSSILHWKKTTRKL